MNTARGADQQTLRAPQATANSDGMVDAAVSLLETTPRVRDVTLDAVFGVLPLESELVDPRL
jgi:hypothetical protein